MRKLRRLCIDPTLLLKLGSGSFRVTVSPIPGDVTLQLTSVNPMTGEIQLFIESEEFEHVLPGCIPPAHPAPLIERTE